MKTVLLAALAATTALVPSAASAATLLYEGFGAPGNTNALRFSFTLNTSTAPSFTTSSTARYFPLQVTFTTSTGTVVTGTTGVNFSFQTTPAGTPTNEQGFLNITNLGSFSGLGGIGSFAVYNEYFTAGNSNAPQLLTGTFNVSTNPNNQPDNYIVRVTNAVPEPATWAMLILGFGLVGGAMRRKSAVRFAAA